MSDTQSNSAAIYVRYRGPAGGPSVRRQIASCREFAKSIGLDVVREYVDRQHSTAQVRPEFERMLEDARAGKFAVVLAEDPGRITRDLATAAKLDDVLSTSPLFVSERGNTRGCGLDRPASALAAHAFEDNRRALVARLKAGRAAAKLRRENRK